MKKESLWSFLTQPSQLPSWQKLENGEDTGQLVLKKEPTRTIDLEDELLRFSKHSSDNWTLKDAVRGTQCFGVTGSGKTSGSGSKLRSAFLKKGMGGLVLCVKTDEAEEWEKCLAQWGRKTDLIRIRANSGLGFNFLDWEQKRTKESGGGLSQNVTDFFLDIISVIDRGNSSQSDGGFWNRTLRELLTHSIVIASLLSQDLTLQNILKVIDHAPKSVKNADDETQVSPLYRKPSTPQPFDEICELARLKCSFERKDELEESISFFKLRFAALADRTRSIVVTSFTSMADPLFREPLKQLFSQHTQVRPEDTFCGKVIVVDLPVHSFQLTGKIANLIWKTAFKRACQQRINPKEPVFLWIDESQYLVDPTDGAFQTTARSSLCCSVFLTQTISNLYAEFGDRAKVEALMSNLHTKIFHQNDDYETNVWASKTIQKLPVTVKSKSSEGTAFSASSGRHTVTESFQWEEDVPGRAFLNLKSGGRACNFLVEGIVLYAGKRFSNGKPWLKATFSQKEFK